MQVFRIGLDLGEVCLRGSRHRQPREHVVVRKRLRRDAMASFFTKLWALVGMEASNGHTIGLAYSWSLANRRLINPRFVTPYAKSNKIDQNDAEVICEAVGWQCDSCHQNQPSNWRSKLSIAFASAYSPTESVSNRFAVFCRSIYCHCP